MKFVIKDEIRGRMRVRVKQNEMTCREADILQYYFDGQKCVTKVKVNERVNEINQLMPALQAIFLWLY